MKKKLSNIAQYLGIIVLFFAGFWLRSLFIKPCVDTIVDTKIITDTIYSKDTIRDTVSIPKPYIIKIDRPIIIRDTVEIINDYYTKKFYNDTIQDDSSAFIVVRDTIWRNKIIYRDYMYFNRMPLSVTQMTQVKRSGYGVYIGINLSQNSLEPLISILKKNDQMYTLGIDVTKLDSKYLYGIHLGYQRRIIPFNN